ncbi:unnamed protein product [Microthlaspi erraticum]|uniref:S1 motif domain-containing protein n=1 Tax=Microthlaspi erraticum TaxID=1685480 RepID=A0A6D2I3D7_9BRAS|nr:unnamed protein product [Microthlaspi erraticum]
MRVSKDRRDRKDEYTEGGGANEPELYQVYKGRVTRVMDAGCFVQFDRFRGKEGLVHVSQMATRRVDKAKDFVKRDMEVYVKVISISNDKYSLSMRDVDQNGTDLIPLKKPTEDDSSRSNPSYRTRDGQVTKTGISGIRIVEESDVAVHSEFPNYDEDEGGMLYQEEGAEEEELEIEMNEDEPASCKGRPGTLLTCLR